MQIFEFYFNPKAREDRFFEIFSFEPQKDSSKGNLYLVGELTNTLPQNSDFLQKLAKVVSQVYSSSPAPQSQEAFFRALLKKANEFLAAELRKGNVDWLGNLHTALLCIKNSGKKSFFAIAKSGTIKAFMTRGTNVVDLGKNIEDSSVSSRGSEVFGSIVSGFAFPQDKLLILTKDIFEALLKDQALSDLSVLSQEKHFQLFVKKKDRILSRLSGILFAVLVEEFTPQVPKLSFLKKSIFSLKLPKFQLTFSQFLRFPVFRAKLPSLIPSDAFKQKIILLCTLVVLLLGGFLVFQGERRELFRQAQTIVLQVQVIQKEAQDALELNDERSANILYQEAWKKASLHIGKDEPFRKTFLALRQKLEKQLILVNHIQEVQEAQVILDIRQEKTELIPQQMVLARDTLYFFNPFSPEIFVFDLQEKKGKTISASANIQYGILFLDSALFFGTPNLLFSAIPGASLQEFELQNPPSFGGMTGFEKNLYFFDSQNGTIAKYQDPLNGLRVSSQWVAKESLKKPVGAKSMTIDGNIWVLTHNNEIQRYFGGLWLEDIQPLMFPLLKNTSLLKTFPGLPYLYLLDPSESRLILLTKSGDLVKQYRMKSPEPLLDFTVSANGNTLYLLSGFRVFQISE